jgi:Luciferase-like monooxygenase.
MAVYRGEVGLQFTTHLAKHYSIPQWVELAAHAQRNKFSQLWINDNLGHRNIFVLLTAIASKVPIKLGTRFWCRISEIQWIPPMLSRRCRS